MDTRFQNTTKRFIAAAMSAILVVSPVLGTGCAAKSQQEAPQNVAEQALSQHDVAIIGALSFVEQAGDNLKATIDLSALNGSFADNISASDATFGMDLKDAKVDSISVDSNSSKAKLVAEFPANGKTPDTLSGYGDIVLSSSAVKDKDGNKNATTFPAVVSLSGEDVVRADENFKMPITKDQFDKYSTYVNKAGKTLGLKKDTINELKEAEDYVSKALGIGEEVASGNYLKAGMDFLRATGILGTAIPRKTDSMKLDEIIDMLNVIDAKLDRQTKLLEQISNKIDQAAIGAFKKELGELKNYVGYVNAYLEYAANDLSAQGITNSDKLKNADDPKEPSANEQAFQEIGQQAGQTGSFDVSPGGYDVGVSGPLVLDLSSNENQSPDASNSSPEDDDPNALNTEEYTAKLLEVAKQKGDSGTISYDAATNGLVDHFSSVVSFLGLSEEQNPITTYYGYMTNVYNFDTQAYIETGMYMQDIDMTLQNVTALLYTTTDPNNIPLLKKFEEQYNDAINTMYAHSPKEPEWTKPYSFVLKSKVSLNAGVLRHSEEKSYAPDFPGDAASDFASRMHYGNMVDELYTAGFNSYNVDKQAQINMPVSAYDHNNTKGITAVEDVDLNPGTHEATYNRLEKGFEDPKCFGLVFDNYWVSKDRNKRNYHNIEAKGLDVNGNAKEGKLHYHCIATGAMGTINGSEDYLWSFWFLKI